MRVAVHDDIHDIFDESEAVQCLWSRWDVEEVPLSAAHGLDPERPKHEDLMHVDDPPAR